MENVTIDLGRYLYAEILKKFWPMRAVEKHCLKTNPNAGIFLPGKVAELKFLGRFANRAQKAEEIKQRVWSRETREVLYECGMWTALEVESLWEFEFLLKNTNPVIYKGLENPVPFKRASFEPIMNALKNDRSYVRFMAEMYHMQAVTLGAKVLKNELEAESFTELTAILVRKYPEKAGEFVACLEAKSELFEQAVWRFIATGVSLKPLMNKLIDERSGLFFELYLHEKEETSEKVLSAVLEALSLRLGKPDCNEELKHTMLCWLEVLDEFIAETNAGLSFLILLNRSCCAAKFADIKEKLDELSLKYLPKQEYSKPQVCRWL